MPAPKPAVLTATDTPVEAHLRHVIETQPVCLTRIGDDGTFLAVNEAALSMLGAERLDQILGTSLLTLVSPAHQDGCRNFLKRISSGGRGSTEVEMTGLGGLQHVLQLHAVALAAPLDGIASALCTFRDVTEHRRLERALVDAAAREKADGERESEWADLTAQLDEARAAAGTDEEAHRRVADLEGVLAEAQARQQELEAERTRLLADLQGAEQRFEQAVSDHLAQVSQVEGALREALAREQSLAERHAGDEARWAQALSDAAAEHEHQSAALRQAVADLERTIESRRVGDTELQQQLAAQTTVHEQQTAELRATIARLEASLAEATERAFELAAANDAARAEWEEKTRQLADAHASELRASEERARERTRDQEAAFEAERSRTQALSGELQALRDGASRQRDEHLAELERLETMLAGAAAEGATLHTRLTEATLERAALERQMARTARLAEAGRLAASLAADLDTTLGAIAQSGRTLLGGAVPADLRPAADHIARGLAEARALVRQLTAIGARALTPLEVDAVAAIRQLEPSLAALLGSRITLGVITAAGRAPVALAPDDLEHALHALVADRGAALSAHGQVTIEVAGVEIDTECAAERGVLPGPYVLVALHMNGAGADAAIPAALVDQPVPDAAWRSASAGLGTVARIVTAAGGHLWLTREGEDALAFELYLPGAGDRGPSDSRE